MNLRNVFLSDKIFMSNLITVATAY